MVEPKEFSAYVYKCTRKCSEKLSLEKQKEFFDHYWNLDDYKLQTSLIATCVKKQSKRRTLHTLVRSSQKRQFSRQFFVNKIQICRDMFVNILNVSAKHINTALYKTRNLKVCDQRGTDGGYNKISEHQKKLCHQSHNPISSL